MKAIPKDLPDAFPLACDPNLHCIRVVAAEE